MASLGDWITELPKENQRLALEITSDLWDVFINLDKKQYLLTTLATPKRQNILDVMLMSNGLTSAFNALLTIPILQGKLIRGRNREFVAHNKKYGFDEKMYLYLLLSESISVFLRNVELFRSCFLFVLKTKPREITRKEKYPFYDDMGIGSLLHQIARCSGTSGEKTLKRIEVDLRNGLTHGLVWKEGLNIAYSMDITFTEIKKISLEDLWKKAMLQGIVTQCLIRLIPAWYNAV